MADIPEAVNIQWHPGFYGAAELEFISNKGDLEFQREFNLSKEPIRMDLLIIKKFSNIRTKNEIGHIFRKFNVVEYLSDSFFYPYLFLIIAQYLVNEKKRYG